MKCYMVLYETPRGLRRHWESSNVKAKSWLAKHQKQQGGKSEKEGVIEIDYPSGKKEILSWLNLNCYMIGDDDA